MLRPKSTAGFDAILHRPRPSAWELFLRGPCVFLARMLYARRRLRTPPRPENAVSVVCISDTHNSQCVLPDGDILIHAGDLTQSGSAEELQRTLSWLHEQKHAVKIVIAGNHDLLLDASRDKQGGVSAAARAQLEWGDIVYLEDGATTVTCPNGRRLNVYGSPRSPRQGNWGFQYARDDDVWANSVPENTDILVTHGPPRAHLDLTRLGCQHLLRELWRVHPLLHVFGHIHAGHGQESLQFDDLQAAFERTLLGGGGIWNLLGVFNAYVRSFFRSPVEASCQLVNAAMVGGLRDEMRRKPIKVYI